MADFRDAVFETVRQIMRRDPEVVTLTNDMNAMILNQIAKEMPERVFNVGIAEQNIMGVAGGLALGGKKVFVFGILAHLISRAWEQIKLDICAPNLPVTILGVGPGLSYGNDGPSHHGTEDLALARALPNLSIFNPCDSVSMAAIVKQAFDLGTPSYIRIDRGNARDIHQENADLSAGFKVWRTGEDISLVSTGNLIHPVLEAEGMLQDKGVRAQVVEVYKLKPVDDQALVSALGTGAPVLVADEHNPHGGLASLLSDALSATPSIPALVAATLPDKFLLGSATRAWAHENYNLSPTSIFDQAIDLISRSNDQ